MSFPVKKLRDSLDDEDVSDDVDDEVFIRDGRSFKLDDDRRLKRPLMAPQRKFKSTSSYFSYGYSSSFRKLRAPFCYTLLCVIILCCLTALALILINMNTNYMLNRLLHSSSENPNSQTAYKPCSEYEIEELWHQTYPKMKSDTPVRSVDVNGDGVEDVIIGYGTGADQLGLPSFTCQMYFGLPEPCAGGVLAVDGKTGALLWQEWLKRSVLKLDCGYDVTQDDVKDCLVSGESGLLCIINGKIGRITWCLAHNELGSWRAGGLLLDFYAGQFIPDMDGDGVVDVMTAHTNGSSATMMGSHVVILSGATGQVLHRLNSIVSGEMMLTSPHIQVRPDGESMVIFCTVHNNSPTSIYVVSLSDLISGDPSLVKTIYSDIEGLSANPILIDMNDDQTEDIVINSKNKLLVFNGLNYSLILNVSYPFGDSYEHDIQFSPVPGYFNNDTIPDFFVTYSVGSTEFLYYSVSTVLDGKTGKSLLSAPIIRSNIPETAGITLSSAGYGNDAFIYWMSSCVGFETNQEDYKLSGRSYEVDICNARFNTSTEIKLMLLSQHVTSPGIVLYSSSANFETEINGSANVLEQVEEYIKLHPDVKEKLEFYQVNRLASSPAKCTAALIELQRNEPPSDFYIPNTYDTEMIPDPVPRAFPQGRFPVDVDSANSEFQPIGADFPTVDDPSRDRDERDDSGKPGEQEASFKPGDPPASVNEGPGNMDADQNDVISSPNEMTKVDKVELSLGSKEVMPRKKRNSNKRMPRRKRSLNRNYEYDSKNEINVRENEMDTNQAIKNLLGGSYVIRSSNKQNGDGTALSGNNIENSLDHKNLIGDGSQRRKKKGKLKTKKSDTMKKLNEDNYNNQLNDAHHKTSFGNKKLKNDERKGSVLVEKDKVLLEGRHLIEQKYQNGIDDNHGGEEFDEYLDETETGKDRYEKSKTDENQGGELIDDEDKSKPRGEEKIRHALKYHNRICNKEKNTKDKRKVNVEDYVDDDKFNYIQYEMNKESLEGKRKKRNKLKGHAFEEVDEDSAEDDDDDDDSEEEGKEDDDNDEREETVQEEIPESAEDEGNSDNEEDYDDNNEEEKEEDENIYEEENYELNKEERVFDEDQESVARNNDNHGNGKRLIRKRRSISPSTTGLSRRSNLPSESRHKYLHGPNHKKKVSMQEKWWKYIMLTNSEDWQMRKKNILKEENKLKEERRKLEERQINVEGNLRIENRTKELEKRNQQLKEDEDNLMKHIPSKKIINLDEQFLNYVKKSLGLKNNESSISNYDVDDVEQLWDDFIETNVLNNRGYGDDYEFDSLLKDKDVIELISKDDSKKKRTELQNSVDDSKHDIETSQPMVSYNLNVDNKDNKPLNNSLQEKLVLASHNSKLENNFIVDKIDLQQKIKHYTTLDQLKLLNRIKNNRTKHNRLTKNNFDGASPSVNSGVINGKKLSENMAKNIKSLKVILKNGENFKYNDYYKWKDNSEYVNFDSYYNILKNTDIEDGNDINGNNVSNRKDKNSMDSVKIYNTTHPPKKLLSSQNNQTLMCNIYFFKRRLDCENDVKSKNIHTARKQKASKKIRKKLHEKMKTNLGIKHIVVNDNGSKGRAIVIEKINYKFPYNFGKEKIYSEKDLELIFNNETHAEIKKIMKLNLRKINDSISKIKNGSVHHHWSHVNYYKSHKLIRNKSENDISNEYDRTHSNVHTTESIIHSNKTTKDMWFNTLHSLKNKQFLKHLKSTSYKSNRVGDDGRNFDKERHFNHFNLLSEKNADLITKKIDLQNNIEKIHISELKNSKNKTNKLFPYRRRDKTIGQDRSINENRIENLFGLTDSMMAKKINETANKTENTVLGLPVGGKFASHLNWHEKTKYGLPLKKWETTTEILANSQRHHRLLKVKKRSLANTIVLDVIANQSPQSNQMKTNTREFKGVQSRNLNHTSKFQKRSTVKKDLSETISFSNHGFEIKGNTPKQITANQNESNSQKGVFSSSSISDNLYYTNDDSNKHLYETLLPKSKTENNKSNVFLDNKIKPLDYTSVKLKESQTNRASNENTSPLTERDNIVKRSIEKYLKILPRASSTPILSSSIVNDSSSIDIIFVTFWVPPKVNIKKLSKTQLDCVREKVLRAKSINCYNEFDDLLIEEEMAKQCIGLDEDNIQYNQYYLQGDAQSHVYNPFNLRFGQLSIYRVRIKCKQCAAGMFEMMQEQGWPSGAGQMSNGVFVQKHRHGK